MILSLIALIIALISFFITMWLILKNGDIEVKLKKQNNALKRLKNSLEETDDIVDTVTEYLQTHDL